MTHGIGIKGSVVTASEVIKRGERKQRVQSRGKKERVFIKWTGGHDDKREEGRWIKEPETAYL